MNVLERVMGPGLAAPETRSIRRLRWAVIVLAALLCLGIWLIEVIRAVLGPVVTGAVFAVLLALTMAVGAIYFIRKSRRDDEWLELRCRPEEDR